MNVSAGPAANCAGDPDHDTLIESVRTRQAEMLRGSRNADAGWPYVTGKRSRIEPTCWALLALAQLERRLPDVAPLRAWRREDGWLVDVPGAPVNHAFNALAAITLLASPSDAHLADPIIANLIASKGLAAAQERAQRQDNSLQAWNWIDGTFSWVEPTAWALLALKKRQTRAPVPGASDRIAVAEQMLRDRVCVSGGWNYGNSNVYGHDLWPYVSTTALALVALQDRRGEPYVRKSLDELQAHVRLERSSGGHALAVLCLTLFGIPAVAARADLVCLAASLDALPDAQNLASVAMTLYSLDTGEHTLDAFRL